MPCETTQGKAEKSVVQYLELDNYEEESDSDEFFGEPTKSKKLIEVIGDGKKEESLLHAQRTDTSSFNNIGSSSHVGTAILLNGVKFLSRAPAQEALKTFEKPKQIVQICSNNDINEVKRTSGATDARLEFSEKEFDILASLSKKECMQSSSFSSY